MEHVRIAKWPEILKLAPPTCPCNTQLCPHETGQLEQLMKRQFCLQLPGGHGVWYLDLIHSRPWLAAPCRVRGLPRPASLCSPPICEDSCWVGIWASMNEVGLDIGVLDSSWSFHLSNLYSSGQIYSSCLAGCGVCACTHGAWSDPGTSLLLGKCYVN